MFPCENDYCIYWQKEHCTLRRIAIGADGRCMECILVPLDQEELARKREQGLAELAVESSHPS